MLFVKVGEGQRWILGIWLQQLGETSRPADLPLLLYTHPQFLNIPLSVLLMGHLGGGKQNKCICELFRLGICVSMHLNSIYKACK